MHEVTQILAAIEAGDARAANRLLPLVYEELRKLAASRMAQEKPGQTIEATALVHEAYVRLINQEQPDYRNRAHFLGIAAHIMRQILIDHARARGAGKRGGGEPNYSLDESIDAAVERPTIMIAIDDPDWQSNAVKCLRFEVRFG